MEASHHCCCKRNYHHELCLVLSYSCLKLVFIVLYRFRSYYFLVTFSCGSMLLTFKVDCAIDFVAVSICESKSIPLTIPWSHQASFVSHVSEIFNLAMITWMNLGHLLHCKIFNTSTVKLHLFFVLTNMLSLKFRINEYIQYANNL